MDHNSQGNLGFCFPVVNLGRSLYSYPSSVVPELLFVFRVLESKPGEARQRPDTITADGM